MAYTYFTSKLRSIILVVALTFMFVTTSVNAKKIEGETPFTLLGSQQTLNSAVLKRGDAITTTRVTYSIMSEASEDIRGFDANVVNTAPKVLAARGTQLFGVTSLNGQKTYCNVDHKPVGPMEGVFVINSDKHTCFIDANNDGLFESSYDLRTKFSHLIPIYYDVEVVGNALSNPVRHTVIDPSRCKLAIWLDVYVQNLSRKGRTATIGVQMRTDNGNSPFTFKRNVNLTSKGETIEVLGAQFTLFYKDEKTLIMSLSKGIEAQPFSTQRPQVIFQIISI